MRGADLIVKTLVEVGVSKIFSLSGNQIMPIYDACINANIEIIHTFIEFLIFKEVIPG